MSTPEGILKGQICKYLSDLGKRCWWDKFNAGPMDRAGKPDIICVYKGASIAIEVKRPDGKGVISGAQRIMAELFTAAGGIWIFADDINKVKEVFETCTRD